MKKSYSLSADCYVIPYQEKGPDAHIAYFPLQSLVFEVNEDAAAILRSLKDKPVVTSDPSVTDFLEQLKELKVVNGRSEHRPWVSFKENPAPTRTLLLLTQNCNLNCLYCYTDAQKSGGMMPLQVARDAVDAIIKNARDQKMGEVFLGFHGGGEPTLNWSVLTGSFNYAQMRCREESLRLNSSLCTNGIITEKQAQWIIDHIQDVAISCDGTGEIHDRQRPLQNGAGSFEKVAATIDYFNKKKKSFAIRLTATEFSGGRLKRVIGSLITRFHPPTICIEPLFVCGRAETSGCKPPSDGQFIKDMTEVYELGKASKVAIQYSGDRISMLLSRFCGAQGSNFFITPAGDVTACLEISERSDKRADFFIYGQYNQSTGTFEFDSEKYQRLAGSQVQSMESCRDCFAKWHCAGDCLAKSPDLSNLARERNPFRCKVNKSLTRNSLIKAMNQQIEVSKSLVKE